MADDNVRAGIFEDVEMYAFRHCSTYTHAHTDIRICLHRRSLRSQQWTHHIQNHDSPFPRSHSWGIVCLWRQTISCFSHVRQLIPLSLHLLDSALVVWIWRRACAGGTMPCSCPRQHIKPGHGSKILPTATTWDNRPLSAGGAVQTLPCQRKFVYLCVHLFRECWTSQWVMYYLIIINVLNL